MAIRTTASYLGSRQPDRKARITLIGVPFNSSGTRGGVADAPRVLRAEGLADRLCAVSELRDRGDLKLTVPAPARDPVSKIIAPQCAAAMIGAVEKAVANSLADSYFPVVLGGDCPVLLGALRAANKAHASTGLLFVDGHEDAYAPSESPSGELADMELGFALGRNLQGVPAAIAATPALVSFLDVVILGARDAEQILKDGGHSLKGQVQIYTAGEITRADLSKVTDAALDSILKVAKSFWLHIDLDVLSSEALPAVNYQQSGGLSWAQLTEICITAVARDSVIGLDVTDYNPELDPGQKKASRIVGFITEVVEHRKR